ncbi:hypothetical protein GJ496_011717 [Pomphorhynchus laevis]|nr:hypothetical protein GJ496_011717 [Pomphorhynchus laevis]
MRNPADDVEDHFHRSVAVANNNILNSDIETSERTLSEMMKRFREEIDERSRKSMEQVSQAANVKWKLILQHASWLGASACLTATPTRLYRSHLNQKQFQVAIATRYNLVSEPCKKCKCGGSIEPAHTLSFKVGGFTIIQHNAVRDILGDIIKQAFGNAAAEVELQPRLLKKAAGRLAEESGQPYGLIITQLRRRFGVFVDKSHLFAELTG